MRSWRTQTLTLALAGMATLGLTAAPVLVCNGFGEPVVLRVVRHDKVAGKRGVVVYSIGNPGKQTDCTENLRFSLQKDAIIALEDLDPGSSRSPDSTLVFGFLDAKGEDLLGDARLTFTNRHGVKLNPGKAGGGARAVCMLDPAGEGKPLNTYWLIAAVATPGAGAGSGAAADPVPQAESKRSLALNSGAAPMDWSSEAAHAGISAGAALESKQASSARSASMPMDLRQDDAGAGGVAAESKAERVLFKAKRGPSAAERADPKARALWLEALAQTEPPAHPDFSLGEKRGEFWISKAAAERRRKAPADAFDLEVGPRGYGEGTGLFDMAMDSGWTARAAAFLDSHKVDPAWAAYYLETELTDFLMEKLSLN